MIDSGNAILDNWDDILKRLSFDELLSLHHKVIDWLTVHQKLNLLKEQSKFTKGDRISFVYQGITYKGTVLKKNQKTISVITDEDGQWNIHPRLIKKLQILGQFLF